MKKYIISLLLFVAVFNLSAQVITQKTTSKKIDETIKLTNKSNIDAVTMPAFDVSILIEEDEINERLDLPYRFGYAFEVDYNMQNSGTWTEVDGGKVWTIKIISKGAYSINLAYRQFYLPPKSQLYIYNEDKTVLQGPFTSMNNTKDGTFSSDLIEGSSIILEYFEPDNIKEKPEISISKIVHAYRNLFPSLTKGYGSSGSCNIDVNCPEGDDWHDESDAVAMILIGDTRLCSGCMVNNTNQDFTPYFLTANHCIEGQNVNNWSFRFQYKSPTCGGGDDYSYYSYYGADLEASNSVSDFALLELYDSPSSLTEISYAGWSRTATSPNFAVGIHHPSGDVMKISFEDDNPIKTNYSNLPGINHWKVIFDEGTAEYGSSGSPLFDPNHRIIGQLHGGYPGCSTTKNFWYGSFDVSWTNGLSQFLDPNNTGAMTTNTIKKPIPYITGTTLVCTSNQTFTLYNRPLNSSLTWTHSSNLIYVSGQGTDNYSVVANGTNGFGWVKATVNGVEFSKTFWVGLRASLGGTSYVPYLKTGTWIANASCGVTPYNYEWWLKKEGGNDEAVLISTTYINELTLKSVNEATNTRQPVDDRVFYLYTKVYDANGNLFTTDTNRIVAGGKVDLVLEFTPFLKNEDNDLDQKTEDYITVFPNPTTKSFTVKIISDSFSDNKDVEIRLYNEFLILQKNKKIQSRETSVNVSDLKKGIYFLQVYYNGKQFNEKIIIE